MDSANAQGKFDEITALCFFDAAVEFRLTCSDKHWTLTRKGEQIYGVGQPALLILRQLIIKAGTTPAPKDRTLSFSDICRTVWPDEHEVGNPGPTIKNRIYKQIELLRLHLQGNSKDGRIIGSIRSRGYAFLLDEISLEFTESAETSMSAADDQETEKESSSLGPASKVFRQRGLLSVVIGRAITFDDTVIIPSRKAISEIRDRLRLVDSDALVEECGRINAGAFSKQRFWSGTGESFEENIEEKTRRNREHYQRNPYTLLLLHAFPLPPFQPPAQFIGFSHVIPLNFRGFTRYRRRLVRDNEFPADCICEPGERAKAILVFSLGVDGRNSLPEAYRGLPEELHKNGEWRFQIGLALAQTIAYHLQVILENHADEGDEIEILAQTDGASDVVRALSKAEFRRTPFISGDGCPIWSGRARRVTVASSLDKEL